MAQPRGAVATVPRRQLQGERAAHDRPVARRTHPDQLRRKDGSWDTRIEARLARAALASIGASPAVEPPILCDCDAVGASERHLDYLQAFERNHQLRGQSVHVRPTEAEPAVLSTSPCEELTGARDARGVALGARGEGPRVAHAGGRGARDGARAMAAGGEREYRGALLWHAGWGWIPPTRNAARRGLAAAGGARRARVTALRSEGQTPRHDGGAAERAHE